MKLIVRNSVYLIALVAIILLLPAARTLAEPNNILRAQAASFSSKTIFSQGYNWNYVIVTPRITNRTEALPLVFLLHGAGGNGETYVTKTGLDKKAISSGFILVAPTGLAANPNLPVNFATNPNLWNSGEIEKATYRKVINDVAFFNDLLNQIQGNYNIDSRKVFVVGHSNGGGMTFRLGAELSHRITAIAPVETSNTVYNYIASRFVPTLLILGAEDPLTPLAGGNRDVPGLPWLSGEIPPASDTIQRWGQTISCSRHIRDATSDFNFAKYQYCQFSYRDPFLVYVVYNQGHEWPGATERLLPEAITGELNKNFKANDVIWDFFRSVTPLR